jgi:hypothetical protein
MSTNKELQRRAGSGPVLGSGVSADHLPSPLQAPDEPVTYFQLEQRRRQLEPDQSISDDIPPIPASHWTHDPVGPEPLIDRSEDGDFIQPEGE